MFRYKFIAGTYRTFYGPEFRPFSNGGRKFGAVVARKRNDGNGINYPRAKDP